MDQASQKAEQDLAQWAGLQNALSFWLQGPAKGEMGALALKIMGKPWEIMGKPWENHEIGGFKDDYAE